MKSVSIKTILVTASMTFVLGLGCAKKAEEDSGEDSSTSSLAKTWNSGCYAKTSPLSLGDHVSQRLDLTDSTFTYQEIWYNGTCTGANYRIAFYSGGTYTTSGSTLSFNVTSSLLQPLMSSVFSDQSAINSSCGGTSPFGGGTNVSYAGNSYSTYMMSCSSIEFPNSGNKAVSNIYNYDGTTLWLGTTYAGVPGQFPTGSVAGSATVPFN